MINKLKISSVHTIVDQRIEKYVNKKIGQLDKYVPRRARQSVYAEVRLKEDNSKDKNRNTCEVVLHLPHETIDSVETSSTMFAAVDLVESKLKQRIRKYKDLHANPKQQRRLFARIAGS